MAKKKDFSTEYNLVVKKYDLADLSKQEQSDWMINKCHLIQGDICTESDSIKYDGKSRASELFGIKLNGGDWLEMVGTGVRSKIVKNIDKLDDKVQESIENKNFVTNINHSIRHNLIQNGNMEIGIPVSTSYMPAPDTITNEELNKLYGACIDTRIHINKVLYKEYNLISKAFQHLWNYELDHCDFKTLVDDIHYENGGYPSPTTPPRTWSKISSFNRLLRAMIKTNRLEYITSYLAMFGLTVQVNPDVDKQIWDGDYPVH